MMNIEVRSERPGDENAIDDVVCRAFKSMEEANLVRALRDYYPSFDHRYSVTAWEGNDMIGHVLFSPATINLMGQKVKSLSVAPVAVIPDRQRSGVGTNMIGFGHELARQEGYALTFLQGHPSYYPRLGYKACYGLAKIVIDVDALPEPKHEFERCPVTQDDVLWIRECFDREWQNVDFSWCRGNELREWQLPFANTTVWRTKDGRRAAYSEQASGGKHWMISGDDPELVRDVILAAKPSELEQHPNGWLARTVVDASWGTASVQPAPHPAAMAFELIPGTLDSYLKATKTGERLQGHCCWPLQLFVC